MADYYSILEKTIAGLPSNTPEVRSAVYKKARAAIETQLRNMDPTPSEQAIGSQLKLLEEAIVLIDSENSAAELSVEQAGNIEDAIPETPAPVLDPTPAEPVASMPTESVTPVPAPVSTSTVAETQANAPAPIPSKVETGSLGGAEPLPAPVVERVETLVDSIPQDAPPTVGLDQLDAERTAELQVPDVGTVAAGTEASMSDPMPDPMSDPMLDPDVNSIANGVNVLDEASEEKKSGGFFSGLLKLLIIAGLLGGAGYATWKNKDVLSEISSSWFGENSFINNIIGDKPDEVAEPAQNNATTQEPEVLVEPVVEQPVTPEPEPTPEPVPAPEPEPEIVEPEIIEPEPVVPEPEVPESTPEPEPEPEAAQAEPQEEPAANQQNGVIPIGEVAYLYEEGSAGSGATRKDAAVTWEIKQESLQPGLPAEPVIFGKMNVPDKGMSLDIKINRNVDPAVSASHMIEILFSIPSDFTGQSIETIARFVMKETEESPGEPLVAVPFKASEGKFLIALDNLPQAVSVNTALLRDASWIDIPLVYGTGKRALLTLEKGGSGARIFSEAFKDWQNR